MNLTNNPLGRLDDPGLSTDERALLRCEAAGGLIHTGQYESAREALGDLWRGIGERPNLEGLDEKAAAEVLLQCGSLTGWLGASKPLGGAQDKAKDLISEALRLFEAHNLQARAAEAEYELAICYWRAGAFDEAHIILRQALERLDEGEIEQRAKILIRSSAVEISAGRYNDALRILKEAESVFLIAPDAVKGRWHAQMAVVLTGLGTAERRSDYHDRAIIEYTAAIYHFDEAKHERYSANNENNLAFLLYKLGRYRQAYEHLDRAQRVFIKLKDAGSLAQVKETRARILLAEKRYDTAANVIARAITELEKADEPALLADALTVQATIEARRKAHARSIATFRRAVKVAEDAGALESAGLAALSMIEEHGSTSRLSEVEVCEVYCRADDLLDRTQDAEAVSRLRACARLITRRVASVWMGAGFTLPEAVRVYEARFIKRALQDAGGSLTSAARRLGIHYQSLAYLLETRHKDLLPARTPAKKRRRSVIQKPEN